MRQHVAMYSKATNFDVLGIPAIHTLYEIILPGSRLVLVLVTRVNKTFLKITSTPLFGWENCVLAEFESATAYLKVLLILLSGDQ